MSGLLNCLKNSSNSKAGFVDDHALILYVYLTNYDEEGDESVLTVRRTSIRKCPILNPYKYYITSYAV